MNIRWARQQGFTIVELLIVIVVIAILAVIVIVAYNGIQNRANDSAVQADLRNLGTAFENYRTVQGTYPTSEAAIIAMNTLPEIAPKVTKSAYDLTTQAAPTDTNRRNLLICVRSGGSNPAYGVAGFSKSGTVWFFTSTNGLVASPDPWRGQQSVTCPRMGIEQTDPGYARWFGYQRIESASIDSGWRGWAAQ